PIGGVKEKVLAARRAGITTVILPKRNEKDLEDVPANVRQEMQFRFTETMDEVLDLALEPATIPVDAKPQGFQQATVSSSEKPTRNFFFCTYTTGGSRSGFQTRPYPAPRN